jgi:hypothetical protein
MLKLDFKDLDLSVSEYQKRQKKLITAVAWLLTQQNVPVSAADALKSLGLKPTTKWIKEVMEFDEDQGGGDIEK